MEKKSFYKTKVGGLTLAFAVIMIAFFVIMSGLKMSGDAVCATGFIMMVAAMLYSPLKVFVIDRKKKG